MNLLFRSRCALPFAAMLIAYGSAPHGAIASITINSSFIRAQANDLGTGTFGSSSSTFTGTSIDNTSSPLDAIHGNSSSLNDISWSASGGQTILSVVMDHQQTGIGGSFSSGASLNREPNDPDLKVVLSVNVPTPYLLSGYYDVQGAGESGMYASLRDASTLQSFFSENRTSTISKVYILGESGAGSTGSLSGILPVGIYNWSFGARILGSGGASSNGDGYFTLTLGDAADPGVVPEAASFLVWGVLGLSTFIPNSCRRRVNSFNDHACRKSPAA